MTELRERHTGFGLDDEGDVVPLEDFSDARKLPHNSFRVGHGESRNYDTAIDQFEEQARLDKITDKNPGVYVTHEQRYQDELDLLDIISGAKMRGGFKKAKDFDKDIRERYGDALPNVAKRAHANHIRLVHRDLPDVYHAKELKEAGVGDQEEVDFDAKATMRTEYMAQYGGPENKAKRAARRKLLKKKLAEIAAQSVNPTP